MADDLEKTQEREPRNRFEMIMAYLRSLTFLYFSLYN